MTILTFIVAFGATALGYMLSDLRHKRDKRLTHRAILYKEDNGFYVQIVRGPMTGVKAHLYPSDMRFVDQAGEW